MDDTKLISVGKQECQYIYDMGLDSDAALFKTKNYHYYYSMLKVCYHNGVVA